MSRKTKQDPTGQSSNRRKSTIKLSNRLTLSEKSIKAMFRGIPYSKRKEVVIVNEQQTVYDYDTSPDQIQQLKDQIQRFIDNQLQTAPENIPFNWWYKEIIEQPYRQGTLEEVVEFNQLVAGAIAAGALVGGRKPQKVEPSNFINTQAYHTSIDNVYIDAYNSIKGLSSDTSKQVFREINNGMSSGLSRREISNAISERFNVSRSNAKRISDTAINQAYNDARMKATDMAAEDTGLRAGVIHISALLKNTRKYHADRHGNAYTTTAQQQWWNEGANKINCFVPDTTVQGRFSGGLKSFYCGKVVKLVTRDGRNLTVTPNHKVMTDTGLIAAAKINKGDNLLAHSIKVEDSIGVRDLDVHQADAAIEDIFASLCEIGRSSVIGVARVNLNGDERFIDKNIDTVFTDRPLVFCNDAEAFKTLDYLSFKHANPTSIAGSSFFERLKGVFLAFASSRSRIGVRFSLFLGHFFSSIGCGTTPAPCHKTNGVKSIHNGCSSESSDSRYLLNGLPVGVHIDKVVDIDVLDFSGHVYDLEESSGLIIANGIIASNCKCTTKTVLIDEDGKVINVDIQDKIKAERAFFSE